MPPEVLKLLVDIRNSLEEIRDFTAGMDYGMYRLDAKCRAAVERKFEIIGEPACGCGTVGPSRLQKSMADHKLLDFEIASFMAMTMWMTRSYGMWLPANYPN